MALTTSGTSSADRMRTGGQESPTGAGDRTTRLPQLAEKPEKQAGAKESGAFLAEPVLVIGEKSVRFPVRLMEGQRLVCRDQATWRVLGARWCRGRFGQSGGHIPHAFAWSQPGHARFPVDACRRLPRHREDREGLWLTAGEVGTVRQSLLNRRRAGILPASIHGQQLGNYAMRTGLSRRGFLAVSAAGVSLAATGGRAAEPVYKSTLHKAVILRADRMNEETFKKLKDAGIEGFEGYTVAVDQAKRARELAEKFGLRIHSAMGGGSAAGLRAAQAYGADAVLAPVGGCSAKPMREPWEFDIKFDEANGHITQLVAGDNEKFKGYIEAHNRSVDGVRESIKKLLPVAEETQVAIALENVWNNWCVRPELYNWVVASFNSPWVKAYFDIGNHVKYAGILARRPSRDRLSARDVDSSSARAWPRFTSRTTSSTPTAKAAIGPGSGRAASTGLRSVRPSTTWATTAGLPTRLASVGPSCPIASTALSLASRPYRVGDEQCERRRRLAGIRKGKAVSVPFPHGAPHRTSRTRSTRTWGLAWESFWYGLPTSLMEA